MLKLQIPKNRMNYLIKQIPLHFDAVRLEQGWEYYHKGRVTEVDLEGHEDSWQQSQANRSI